MARSPHTAGRQLRGRMDQRAGPLPIRLAPGEVYIWDCATLPAYRGQGLYPALLAHIVKELSAEGLRRAWIGADTGSEPLKRHHPRRLPTCSRLLSRPHRVCIQLPHNGPAGRTRRSRARHSPGVSLLAPDNIRKDTHCRQYWRIEVVGAEPCVCPVGCRFLAPARLLEYDFVYVCIIGDCDNAQVA